LLGIPKCVIIDNEKALIAALKLQIQHRRLDTQIFTTPPHKSEANGQVERFHSTLTEIIRCLKAEGVPQNFKLLLKRCINEYNETFHSVTNKKPIDLFLGQVPNESTEEMHFLNTDKIKRKELKDLNYHNKKRKPIKNYNVGDVIYVKHNKRLGTKLTFRFKKEIVREDRNTTVLTNSGKVIHKSNRK
jgi:hypothetical protein